MDKKLVGSFLITLIAIIFTVSLSYYTSTQSDQNSLPYPTPTPTLPPRMDNRVLLFENGSESNLYLVNSSLSYEFSEVDQTIPIKGRTLNVGDAVVVITGEVLNNYDGDYYFAISGDLFTSEGEKLEGTDYLMNEPVGEFTVLNVSSSSYGIFELLFKYDGRDIESYELFLALEPQDSPPA